jgi:hypothetical protein
VDIGKTKRIITIEPIEDPVPRERPAPEIRPAPEREPVREPERVGAEAYPLALRLFNPRPVLVGVS